MKQVIKVVILVLILVGFVTLLKGESDSKEMAPLVSFKDEAGNFSIKIREKEKEELKGIVLKIKNLVYKEATIHNPPGDMLPDGIDNTVIKEVKERVN